ncbi:MAG: ROK family transcriptional regulator [Burkholderiaceae bacterium]|nr:ROK family transcriptional regulator [Burkholderiaceae bacterium]
MSAVAMSGRERALAAIRSPNARVILRELLGKGPRSRSAIAQATRLTETAVSRAAQRLIAEGVLAEGKQLVERSGPGRPSVELEFGSGFYVAGIGIRGYTQWVELRRLGGEPIVSEQFACEDLTDPIAVLRRCCNELDALLRNRRVPRHRVLNVGVLIVGVVDPATGTVLRAENLGWRRVEVKRILEDLTDFPLTIETMLNGMNLQQRVQASAPLGNSLLVSVALGIGASVIVDGRITRGCDFAAGQLGHLRSRGSTMRCVCGRIGCLDTVASGRAILRENGLLESGARFGMRELAGRFRKLSSAAQSHPDLAGALARAGHELGNAIGGAIALLDPREIVFTGFVIDDDHYFDAVRDELSWYRTGTSAQRVDFIRRQQGGEGAPSMSAALSLAAEAADRTEVPD